MKRKSIMCKTKKTVCIIFRPKSRDNLFFLCFTINSCKLNFVSQFKYLEHINIFYVVIVFCAAFVRNKLLIISDTTNDDDDLKRESRNFLVSTNALISKFYRCCIIVKLVLFKTFCLCMYGVALWKYYLVTVFNKKNSNLHTINLFLRI